MADYAISNVPRRVVYAASGVGPYAFTFEILNQTDIAVYKASTLLTLTTDYTVTINANGTGSVTLVTSAGTSNITIVGAKNIQRTTDFTTGGDLFANTLNDELDNQTIFIQQVAETAERGLKAPVVDPTDINMTLPAKASRVGTVLAFNATTGNPEAGPSIGSVTTVAAQSANINTVAANITPINTVATNISNVNTVSGISGNVTTVASSISNVNTVADDLNEAISEINTVAVNIGNVNLVGTNIGNVNNVASISGNVTTVASNSTNINTVATNIANVNTVGGISSNVTTVAGISANVTSVAGNAANINIVAADTVAINAASSNAANAASSATAASNSATSASGSASTATTQASNAAGSASAAATSASNAATSETNAATSATNSANSATASAASATTAVNAPGTSGTSTTSITIPAVNNSVTFTTQTAKAWVVGQFVTVSSTASPANFMYGYITAYNSGTGSMTVFVQTIGGSGTLASWSIGLSAPVAGTVVVQADVGYNPNQVPLNQYLGKLAFQDLAQRNLESSLATSAGLTAVTAVTGSLTLATGGVTLANQTMASGSVWRIRAYGTYAAISSANTRQFTLRCLWGSTSLTATTSGNVLTSTAQTFPWSVEFVITGSSATAVWVTGILSSQVTSATIPLNNIATAASVTGLTTNSTLDFQVGQTGTATGDTINVHSVTMERLK